MARALALAGRGVGLTHPNPTVGAVIVKDGIVSGEGFHDYDGLLHAEIVALKKAGPNAPGATLYVTLEPCSHIGRTGPCTRAIIEAGIRRVVASIADPNPRVAGNGFAQLRRAGIEVTPGAGQAEAQRLNEGFTKWIRTRQPFVTLKTALTLDGQIAMRPGHSTAISSSASRQCAQRMRHEVDALLTGIGTILIDDPLLTDRSGLPRRRKLLRVILDSHLRLPLKSRIVKSADNDVLVFTAKSSDSAKARVLTKKGVEVFRISARGGRVDLRRAVRELGRRQILNVLLEAGAELNGAALEAGIVDKLLLFYSPRIMGTGGVPMAEIASRQFPRSRPIKNYTVNRYGDDFIFEGYIHDVYGNHRSRGKN